MKRAFSRKNMWDCLPAGVKSGIGRTLGFIPQAYLLGKQFRHQLAFAQAADRWPIERSQAYQLEQLRQICSLAYDKTVYYRQAFKNVGFEPGDLKTLSDVKALPLIDKGIVRKHLNELWATDPNAPGIDYVSTGGSSGEPLHFYMSANRSAIEYGYLVSVWQRAGYDLNMKQVVLRGNIVTGSRNGLHHEYDPILRRHYYSNFHTSDEDLARYCEHMRTIGPFYLHVYPSSIDVLARFVQRSKTAVPKNLFGILAGSENVDSESRAFVERTLGVRYFSWYGHSEKLVLAAECEQSTHQHVCPTYGYFELIDDKGQTVSEPGRRGEIVGTGFMNRVMPFIRYRTGDYATYVSDRCELCGRHHPVMTDIDGRSSRGSLLAGDGSYISMVAINIHDDTFDKIANYQFRQSRPGEATLCIVPARPLSHRETQGILDRLNTRLQGQVQLTIEVCQEIEKTHRGKTSRVIQK